MKQQQGKEHQLDLFDMTIQDSLRLSQNRETVSGSDERKEFQVAVAGEQERALATNLMQMVLSPENLKRAHKQVKKNKGAAGIEQMLVGEFAAWYAQDGNPLLARVYADTYEPQGVREVEIPKDNGSMRKPGYPNSSRQDTPTSNSPSTKSNLWRWIFWSQLWFSPKEKCTPSTGKGKPIRGGWKFYCSRYEFKDILWRCESRPTDVSIINTDRG